MNEQIQTLLTEINRLGNYTSRMFKTIADEIGYQGSPFQVLVNYRIKSQINLAHAAAQEEQQLAIKLAGLQAILTILQQIATSTAVMYRNLCEGMTEPPADKDILSVIHQIFNDAMNSGDINGSFGSGIDDDDDEGLLDSGSEIWN